VKPFQTLVVKKRKGGVSMRRAVYLVIAVALVAVLAGYFREKGESFTGLILSVAENRVLVVAGMDDAEMEYEKLLETGNRAIWFSVDKKTEIRDVDGRKTVFESLQKGQKVEVRFSGPVMESYPEQAGADKIFIR
jgi:hypothetical protein